jgi:hypothetical protein
MRKGGVVDPIIAIIIGEYPRFDSWLPTTKFDVEVPSIGQPLPEKVDTDMVQEADIDK